MRYDLAFFLCCCKSFLGSPEEDQQNEESFYSLLGVERDASPDEIKRAYKRQSLQMHPDKLAQRGKTVTEADQAKFTRMKEAYECLSDPHKRETYDTIGERGMKWLDEPFSMDPQELAHNFAKSSALDRSKIFAIFVAVAIALLILPILVCLHIDGVFGANAPWMATLTPLWIWDLVLLAYHVRIIMMGPIQRPEHIPPEEWVDPLPMKKRIFSMARFVLIVLFELLAALRLDQVINCKWTFVFIPLYIWEATTLYKRWPLAQMRIVTVEDLEIALGKPFAQFTAAEKELIGKRYSVVPSTSSPDFEAAQKLKSRARQDMMKSMIRIVFVALLLVQIDGLVDWNWWLVFTPFWIMTLVICLANYQSFAAVQQMAAEKDPTLFGMQKDNSKSTSPGSNGTETGTTNYGSVGPDGAATPEATNTQPQSELSEEEREELKAAVLASSSKLCSKCCSQGFMLILMCLFVAKLQGAGFSSLWIISPFLFAASIILCCLGLAIFGITEVPTDGVGFDPVDFVVEGSGESLDGGTTSLTSVPPGNSYAPPTTTAETSTAATDETTDPELGGQPQPPSRTVQDVLIQDNQPFGSQPSAELCELD
ncbi:chaperone DnaJ domain containing protein [Nitzschia inconspicua]|uniref:Chaperone DnaJ domain containing protein n=1 Tax=Nitzschia inconspicua TaxID=303405 RepID=A0A9K3PG97_9STRA|nr:chaperone DnaJ domain containing protein [Nitzschia inconspicua]